MIYFVLPVVALLTSALSGMIGMGGGMLLLAAMFSCGMPHGEAIPSHATVQLVSNSTRTLAFLRHVDWPTVGRFLIGVIPGSVIGVLALVVVRADLDRAEPYLRMLVACYILVSIAIPTRTDAEKHRARWWDFPLLGFAAGAAAYTVGAVGPLIAPLFARRAFVKERLVATKAVCQTLLHIAKIPVFLQLGTIENVAALGLVTLVMAVLVVPGTLIGKRLLKRVSAGRFVTIYRAALLVAGLKVLVVDGIWALAR